MDTESSREWFTTAELVGLPLMPTTDRSIRRMNLKPSRPRSFGKGQEYHITSLPKETQRALRIRQTKQQQAATHQTGDLNNAQLKGALEGMKQAGDDKAGQVRQLTAFNQLSPKEQARVKARIEVLTALEVYITDFDSLNQAIREFIDAYNGNQLDLPAQVKSFVPKVSRPSLFRWRSAYASEGAAGLSCHYKGAKRSQVDSQPELLAFAEGMIAKLPHVAPTNLLRAMEGQFDQCSDINIPGVRAITTWLSSWKVKNKRLFTAVSNPDAFKNKYQVAGGDAAGNVVRLNQIWEMDSSPADLMCTDGRFTIISCIDVYSRRAVFKVRKTSDSFGVVLTARQAMLDWGLDGQGEQKIRVDNGSDYASHYFQIVADTLNIQLMSTDPYAGEQKPFVERLFRSFAHGLVEMLPGFIGHNVAERQAIEAQFSFADRLKRKAGSSKNVITVSMTSTDLQAFCDRWLNAFYMHNAHSGLNGATPFEMVQNWMEPVRRIEDERVLDLLLEPIPGNKGERTVQKKGLKLDGGWYQAAEMGSRVGDLFMVRYDTADIGRIYLFELTGEFVCMAQNASITGISREELAYAMKKEQKKVAAEKAELKKKGRKINQNDLIEKIFIRREREIAEKFANVTALPKRSHDHQTGYLSGAAAALAAGDQAKQEEAARQEREANPSQEMVSAMAGFMTDRNASSENKQAGKPSETPYDRFRRWVKLDERATAGEVLSEFEQRWKAGQETTSEWQGHKMIFDEFGKTAFGIKD